MLNIKSRLSTFLLTAELTQSSIHPLKAEGKSNATRNQTSLVVEDSGSIVNRRSTHLTYSRLNLSMLQFLGLYSIAVESRSRSSMGVMIHKYLHREQSMLVLIASFKLNEDNINTNISSGSVLIRTP